MPSQIIEIVTHPEDSSDGKYHPRDIPAENIAAWFKDSLDRCRGSQSTPSVRQGSLRFVIVDLFDPESALPYAPVPPREAVKVDTREVERVMDLLNFDSSGTKDSVCVTKLPQSLIHGDGASSRLDSMLTYRVNWITFDLAWSYFPETDTTLGIVVHFGTQSSRIAENFLKALIFHQCLANHPMLPALFAHMYITPEMEDWLATHARGVEEAQAKTGYHIHLSLPRTSQKMQTDYGELSAAVSGIAANIATNRHCWQGLLHLANLILEENKSFAQSQPVQRQEVIQTTLHYIAQHAAHQAAKSKSMLEEAESWQQKATIQIQGLFNLIAQRDQRLSINVASDTKRLAEDSKRDSTSMKAIAAVTIFFLPGTFAASLFSMPMFQWNAPVGSNIVSERFWIYWAVTGPLTTLTILAWLVWTWWRNEVYVASSGEKMRFWPTVIKSLRTRAGMSKAHHDARFNDTS